MARVWSPTFRLVAFAPLCPDFVEHETLPPGCAGEREKTLTRKRNELAAGKKGTHVYLFKAYHHIGNAKLANSGQLEEFAWVTKSEAATLLEPEFYASIQDFLL